MSASRSLLQYSRFAKAPVFRQRPLIRRPVSQCVSMMKAQPAVAVTPVHEDLIKETLKRMIWERDHAVEDVKVNPVSDEDLEHRFEHFQAMFHEAKACIADLEAASEAEKDEECDCAREAVENVFQAYMDLLDDLRVATEDQVEVYSEARLQNACDIKELRQELEDMCNCA